MFRSCILTRLRPKVSTMEGSHWNANVASLYSALVPDYRGAARKFGGKRISFCPIFRPPYGFTMAFARHVRTTSAILLTNACLCLQPTLSASHCFHCRWIFTFFIKHYDRFQVRKKNPFQHTFFGSPSSASAEGSILNTYILNTWLWRSGGKTKK